MIIYFVYWGFRARRLQRSFCAQITLLIIVWIRIKRWHGSGTEYRYGYLLKLKVVCSNFGPFHDSFRFKWKDS